MGGTGKRFADLEAGAAGMLRRAMANGASPMHFVLSLGSFVALWAYLALSPSEAGFFMREFVRFEIPPTKLNHVSNELIYGLGYGIAVIWLIAFVWISTMRASLMRGFGMAWAITAITVTVLSCGTAFLGGAFELFTDMYVENGRSVFNVLVIVFGTVIGVGMAFVVLAVVANGLGGARD